MDKKELLKTLQRDWKKYWDIKSIKDLGFNRYICKKCGKAYWALEEQENCNDSSCREYDFIGNPIGRKLDYFKTWELIKKFFIKEGHCALERYPTVCRWYPLFFTIAGIVNFYRMDQKKLTFEFPANPSILNQPCLRFNDIPNVGVSGRHFTSFNMIQQSSLYNGKTGYWKDRCMELDYRLLTEVFKIRPEEINFIEDVWLGYGAFGYSLEYHVRGLELGNAVFTEFEGTPERFRVMKEKVVDMGAGHERFTWISQGTTTAYDAVFGPILEKMRIKAGIEYDRALFLKFSRIAGVLNWDEVVDLEKMRSNVAKRLGVSPEELRERIEPMQAIYSIADHSKALLFAITDGGLPSNIGGGYNLRVILRRALGFIDRFSLPFDIIWVAERMAKYLKPMYPELKEHMPEFQEILSVEEKRYKGGAKRARMLIENIIKKRETLDEKKIIELYDSHGITPELIREVGKKYNFTIKIPLDLYAKVAEKHMEKGREKEKVIIDVSGLPDTEKLFYKNMKMKEFNAKVLKVVENKYVVLDKTAFFPRGGGQEPDHGYMNGHRVYDVEQVGGVIVHSVENPSFKEGESIKCVLDWKRRKQITIHHDATHIINAAARTVLGPWVWQEGSKKDVEKAHLDVDHYKALEKEQIEKIEALSNEIVKKGLKIEKLEMERSEAEKKFGFIIYQGGAVPSKRLKIVKIGDFDIEACGGTHGDNTKEIEHIIITKVERPSDGTVRFIYKAGPAAKVYLKAMDSTLKESAKLLGVEKNEVPSAVSYLFEMWKRKRKELEKLRVELAKKRSKEMKFREKHGLKFLIQKVSDGNIEQLREISRILSRDETVIVLIGIVEKVYIFGSAGRKAVKMGIDISNIVSNACKIVGGKGGGTADLAQGSGPKIEKVNECIEAIKKDLNLE